MKSVAWCIGTLSLVLVLGTLWLLQQNLIVRLPSGFYPATIHVDAGESVRFINLNKEPTWPASGPHPTHTSYPAFDPQQGIAFGALWSHIFDAEGTFSFHNHFAPAYGGIVVVGDTDLSDVADMSSCTDLPDPVQEEACVEIYFRNVVANTSYTQARAIYEELVIQYPNSCHGFAHDLGRGLYNTYLEGSLPDIGPEASSCSYGLWHGFTTAMQNDRGFTSASEFCGSLTGSDRELEHINRVNCYHGIGIGLIPDVPPAHLWGEFQQLVDPALAYCDTVQSDPLYTERCHTGVFHAMTDFMVNKNVGFVYDSDSLRYCAQQRPEHQYACFITLSSAIHTIAGTDLTATVAILKKHNTSEELFLEMFLNAAIMMVDATADLQDHALFVERCEQEDILLRERCIKAVLIGLYANGVPGLEYQDAFAFCSGSWIRETEQGACMFDVINHARRMYTSEKTAQICAIIPSNHRKVIDICSAVSTPTS